MRTLLNTHSSTGLEGDQAITPMPVWVAALIASHCQATVDGQEHEIRWKCEGGRLLYTNPGPATELIEPLGVKLKSGDTLAVSWVPRETSYTIEVFRQLDCCA